MQSVGKLYRAPIAMGENGALCSKINNLWRKNPISIDKFNNTCLNRVNTPKNKNNWSIKLILEMLKREERYL